MSERFKHFDIAKEYAKNQANETWVNQRLYLGSDKQWVVEPDTDWPGPTACYVIRPLEVDWTALASLSRKEGDDDE